MATNPFMRAKEVTPQQTYIDQYVPLPFDQFKANVAAKDKVHGDLLGEIGKVTAIDGRGHTGTGDEMFKAAAKNATDILNKYVEDNPALADNPQAARDIINKVSKELKFGLPAYLQQEHDKELKYSEHIQKLSESKDAQESAKWRAKALDELNRNRSQEEVMQGKLYDVSAIGMGVSRAETAMKASSDIATTGLGRMSPRQSASAQWLMEYANSKGVERNTANLVTGGALLNDEGYLEQVRNDIRKQHNDPLYEPNQSEIANEVLEDIRTEEARRTHKLTDYGYKSAPDAMFGAGQKFAPGSLYVVREGEQFNIKNKYEISDVVDLNSQINTASNILKQNVSDVEKAQASIKLKELEGYRESLKQNLISDPKVISSTKDWLRKSADSLYPELDRSKSAAFGEAVAKLNTDKLLNQMSDLTLKGIDNGQLIRVRNENTGIYEIKINPETARDRTFWENVTKAVDFLEHGENPMLTSKIKPKDNAILELMGDLSNDMLEEMQKPASTNINIIGMDKNDKYVKSQHLYKTMAGLIGANESGNINVNMLMTNFRPINPSTGEKISEDDAYMKILNAANTKVIDYNSALIGNKPVIVMEYEFDGHSKHMTFEPQDKNFKKYSDLLKQSLVRDYNNIMVFGNVDQLSTNVTSQKNTAYAIANPNINEYLQIKSEDKTIHVTPVDIQGMSSAENTPLRESLGLPISNGTVPFKIKKVNGYYYVNGEQTSIKDPVVLDYTLQKFIQNK